jgi:hypothetical protein
MLVASVFYRESTSDPWKAAKPHKWAINEDVVRALKGMTVRPSTPDSRPVTIRHVGRKDWTWKIYLVEI